MSRAACRVGADHVLPVRRNRRTALMLPADPPQPGDEKYWMTQHLIYFRVLSQEGPPPPPAGDVIAQVLGLLLRVEDQGQLRRCRELYGLWQGVALLVRHLHALGGQVQD